MISDIFSVFSNVLNLLAASEPGMIICGLGLAACSFGAFYRLTAYDSD